MQMDFVRNVILIFERHHANIIPSTRTAESRIHLAVSKAFLIDGDADLRQ